jgi:valyl-tRNA synthetase
MRFKEKQLVKIEDVYTLQKKLPLPWKNIMLSGWCLASDKTKMSKSKGNIITPKELIEDKGVDVVRFWCASSGLGMDTAYNEKLLDTGKKFLNKFWNCGKFIELQLDSLTKEASITEEFDKWILYKLDFTIKEYHKYFQAFEYAKARASLDDFFWNNLCDNYMEIIKVRYYGLKANIYANKILTKKEEDKIILGQQSCILATKNVINSLVKLYAPFTPYICEELNKTLFNNIISIHNQALPKEKNINFDDTDICKMLKIIELVRKHKSENNLPLNSKIEEFTISSNLKCTFVKDLYNVTGIDRII